MESVSSDYLPGSGSLLSAIGLQAFVEWAFTSIQALQRPYSIPGVTCLNR